MKVHNRFFWGALSLGSLLAFAYAAAGCGSDASVTRPDQSQGGEGGSAGEENDASTGEDSAAGAAQGGGGQGGEGGQAGEEQDGSVRDVTVDESSAPDVNFGYDAPLTDHDLDPDTACGSSAFEATLTPLDMYIMIDRSGSMVEPGYSWSALPTGGITVTGGDCDYNSGVSPLDSKWCYSVYALAGYFGSSQAAGNRVALQFYPQEGYVCEGGNDNVLATPAIGYQTLPSGRNNLINTLNDADPLGSNTPTRAALHGLNDYTASTQSTGRITIGVLITDGVPNSCAPNTGESLGTVVADQLNSTGIRTYVIGMTGANFSTLEEIASQGGVPSHSNYCSGGGACHYYNVGNGNSQVFIDVLRAIQQNAIGCTYQVPSTVGLADLANIKVEYAPGNGGAHQILDRVSGASSCYDGAWYLEMGSPPTIHLCSQTCSQVQQDSEAKINILVGCQGS